MQIVPLVATAFASLLPSLGATEPAAEPQSRPATKASAPVEPQPDLGSGGAALEDGRFSDGLTGRDIYARVLENRFRAFTQESSLSSGDRAGRIQETRMEMHWKNFDPAGDEAPGDGVLSKTLVKYTYPFDLRHSGYLIIQNEDRANDQFVYLPERRQTRRVNLRGESVFGSDFSFEDLVPREIEDATYVRRPDEELDGVPVFVVIGTPTEHFDSDYSKFAFHIDRETAVALRTRYWDLAGVEVKELRTERAGIERVDDVHVPMVMTMRNLVQESFTTLRVTHLVPNPDLPRGAFGLRQLQGH